MTQQTFEQIDSKRVAKCIEVVRAEAYKAFKRRGLSDLQMAWKLKVENGEQRLLDLCIARVKKLLLTHSTESTPEYCLLPADKKEIFARGLAEAGGLVVQEYLEAKVRS